MNFKKTSIGSIHQILENILDPKIKNLQVQFIKIKGDFIKFVDKDGKSYYLDIYEGLNIFENKKTNAKILETEPKNLEFKSGGIVEKILKQKLQNFKDINITHQDDIITLSINGDESLDLEVFINKCEIVDENFIFVIDQIFNTKKIKIFDLRDKTISDLGSYNGKIEYIEAFGSLIAFRVKDGEFSQLVVYDPKQLKQTKSFSNVLYTQPIKSIIPYEKEDQIVFLGVDDIVYRLEII